MESLHSSKLLSDLENLRAHLRIRALSVAVESTTGASSINDAGNLCSVPASVRGYYIKAYALEYDYLWMMQPQG